MKLVSQEEEKIATRSNYRTSARTLRRLAESSMVFELYEKNKADWDRFSVRKLGLAVQGQMAKRGGDVEKFLSGEVERLTRTLGVPTDDWPQTSRSALHDFAAALSLTDLRRWSDDERQALRHIIRAKNGRDESRYLKLMQKNRRLRSTVIKLGSE